MRVRHAYDPHVHTVTRGWHSSTHPANVDGERCPPRVVPAAIALRTVPVRKHFAHQRGLVGSRRYKDFSLRQKKVKMLPFNFLPAQKLLQVFAEGENCVEGVC